MHNHDGWKMCIPWQKDPPVSPTQHLSTAPFQHGSRAPAGTGWVTQLPQSLLCHMGQHWVSWKVRRSWYLRDDLPLHAALGAGLEWQKAAGRGNPLPFQVSWLGIRRANSSQGEGTSQKGQGRPRAAWEKRSAVPRTCSFQWKSLHPLPEHHLFLGGERHIPKRCPGHGSGSIPATTLSPAAPTTCSPPSSCAGLSSEQGRPAPSSAPTPQHPASGSATSQSGEAQVCRVCNEDWQEEGRLSFPSSPRGSGWVPPAAALQMTLISQW